jgi:hypothetical protein
VPAPPLATMLPDNSTMGASTRMPPPEPPASPELPFAATTPLMTILPPLVSWIAPPPAPNKLPRAPLSQPPRRGTRVSFPVAAPGAPPAELPSPLLAVPPSPPREPNPPPPAPPRSALWHSGDLDRSYH